MGIETGKARRALKPRREPYWHAVGTGQHVGFRRTDEGGHWIARAYDPATRQRAYKALGDFAHLPENEQFTAAGRTAREWFDHLAAGGRAETLTVSKACARYVTRKRTDKGQEAADDAAARFARYVDNDPLGAMPLPKLQRRHVEAWRDRLANEPAKQPKRGKHCRVKAPQPEAKRRSPATVNRDMAVLRAALNLALRDGYVTNDQAWAEPLKPIKDAGGRRELYLSREQRRALIDALPSDDLRAFVTGLCLLPLRPGALAGLNVADYDARHKVLRIGKDKAGKDRKILLPEAAAELFKVQARGKLPAAPLLARWDGERWHKDAWKKPIAQAVAAAELPAGATAYTLRHSTITDLTTNGLDLFTVAALSGTSIAMIEKHYGHLQQEKARDALAGLVL